VRLGWTQLQIAGNTFYEVDQLCRLYALGRIQLRLYDAIYGPSADANRLLAEGPDPQHCGGKLALRGIKLYIDGALGSRGAALLEPYSDSSPVPWIIGESAAGPVAGVDRAEAQGCPRGNACDRRPGQPDHAGSV
jgi:predicted amidohydrolase YtcJ